MLTLENLSFDVNDEKGEIGIIKDISFTVDDGKFVVITGPNGGGKSTTAKLIMGIERPTGGRILFDGQDITDMSITDRANLGISFAFQQPVRFKGVQVIDLLRLAARKKLTVSEACQYLAEVKLSVFDEPEAGIDLWSFQNLIQVFERMRQNTNGSILIISHQERILNIADEIVVIADGKVVNQGTRDEIMPQIMGTASAVDACSKFYETAQ